MSGSESEWNKNSNRTHVWRGKCSPLRAVGGNMSASSWQITVPDTYMSHRTTHQQSSGPLNHLQKSERNLPGTCLHTAAHPWQILPFYNLHFNASSFCTNALRCQLMMLMNCMIEERYTRHIRSLRAILNIQVANINNYLSEKWLYSQFCAAQHLYK